jgi:hypothetical protein
VSHRSPDPTVRRAVALLLILFVLPVLALSRADAPAAAQDAGEAPAARLTVAAIDSVAASGGTANWAIVIEHAATDTWQVVEVVAELHAALGSRSALRTALAGGSVPRLLQRTIVPVAAPTGLRPGSVARIDGAVPLTGPGLSGPSSAVHPLRFRVLADGAEVGRIDTALVRIGAPPVAPLATTLVWPLSSPPARDAGGDPSAALDPLTLAGGRLDTLTRGLAGLASADEFSALASGVALAVPTHLVEDLALRSAAVPVDLGDEPDGGPPSEPPGDVDEAAVRAALLLQRLRSGALALQGAPLVTPYADADLGRLLASGSSLQPLAARALLEGSSRVPALLGRPAAPVVLLDAPVAPAVLDLLPVATVVVPHAAIASPDLTLDIPLGEPVRSLRSPTGRTVTALVGDPYLTGALGAAPRGAPADPVRAAHEVVVRTAMVHLEAPGREGRVLVLLPPPDFDPDPRFVEELLRRLAGAPWLAPTSIEGVMAATGAAPEPARLSSAPFEPLPVRLSTALVSTARGLELLASAVDVGDVQPDDVLPVGDRTLGEATDELLRATSRAFSTDVERAVALLAGVRAGTDGAFGTLVLTVDDVTLTDRDGRLPITFAQSGVVPVRVRLELTGPAALTWPEGRVRELTLDVSDARSIEVPLRASGTGRFPVTIRVTDPTGERLLASEVVSVRATAIAQPALLVIGSAVLALTVVGTLRQRRRGVAWRTVDDREAGR